MFCRQRLMHHPARHRLVYAKGHNIPLVSPLLCIVFERCNCYLPEDHFCDSHLRHTADPRFKSQTKSRGVIRDPAGRIYLLFSHAFIGRALLPARPPSAELR